MALCVGGSQFQHKLLTLPTMSEKKLYAVLARELSTAGVEADAPLDDYLLLHRDAKTKTDTMLACRVESALVESYAALAKDAGLTLSSLDYTLSGQLKLTAATPALAGSTFVVLHFDGDTLLATLYEQGVFTSMRAARRNPAMRSPKSCPVWYSSTLPTRAQSRSPPPTSAAAHRTTWTSAAPAA